MPEMQCRNQQESSAGDQHLKSKNMFLLSFFTELLYSGFGNLASYIAAHVLLCLLPAFYIAGAMTALIAKETVTRFLGRNTPKFISYPAAALAGSVLAVCSCTIVPLFAGIYKKGAGIGPGIIFLFFAPAANIFALHGRSDRSRPGCCSAVPLAGIWHRHWADHGTPLPSRRCGTRQNH